MVIREQVGFSFDKTGKDGLLGVAVEVYGTGLPYTPKN